MLEKLTEMFVGKNVRITHTNERVPDVQGVCKAIHKTPGTDDHFDLEFKNGSRYGFTPETLTSTSSDGELRAFAGGRRKIEIVQ